MDAPESKSPAEPAKAPAEPARRPLPDTKATTPPSSPGSGAHEPPAPHIAKAADDLVRAAQTGGPEAVREVISKLSDNQAERAIAEVTSRLQQNPTDPHLRAAATLGWREYAARPLPGERRPEQKGEPIPEVDPNAAPKDAPPGSPGKAVVAEAPTTDGSKIKVTEDGDVQVCTNCQQLRAKYAAELADPKNKPFKDRLDAADKLTDKLAKLAECQAIHQELVGAQFGVSKAKVADLGTDPAIGSKYRGNEAETALRVEQKLGVELERFKPPATTPPAGPPTTAPPGAPAKPVKGDWVDKNGVKYDGCSPPDTQFFDQQMAKYETSLRDHVSKVDKTVIDITGLNLTTTQISQLEAIIVRVGAPADKLVRIP
jgi:hypothetical protein